MSFSNKVSKAKEAAAASAPSTDDSCSADSFIPLDEATQKLMAFFEELQAHDDFQALFGTEKIEFHDSCAAGYAMRYVSFESKHRDGVDATKCGFGLHVTDQGEPTVEFEFTLRGVREEAEAPVSKIEELIGKAETLLADFVATAASGPETAV